jgi:DNA-binding SARP family transcriptional activator
MSPSGRPAVEPAADVEQGGPPDEDGGCWPSQPEGDGGCWPSQPDEAGGCRPSQPDEAGGCWPIEIQLLGGFRLLKAGRPLVGRAGGKIEALLSALALSHRHYLPRETLLFRLWPNSEPALAGQSLNGLLYSVRLLLGDRTGGAWPVLSERGGYRLNTEAGISVDVDRFDALASAGDSHLRSADTAGAMDLYTSAARLYRGDLGQTGDAGVEIERERLRARYLTILGRLADHRFRAADYTASLDFALALLRADPCREDAHRLLMRCYVRQGERAQAIRQFRLCELVLRTEFEAAPERATLELLDQIRCHPESV